jgi:hypothetical protein
LREPEATQLPTMDAPGHDFDYRAMCACVVWLPCVIPPGCSQRAKFCSGRHTGAGEDHGGDNDKNWLRFPYVLAEPTAARHADMRRAMPTGSGSTCTAAAN